LVTIAREEIVAGAAALFEINKRWIGGQGEDKGEKMKK
jgi:hypothetical protein